MNPALKPVLAAIEAGVVRIEYARDDEHAQREAEELLDNARTLLGILNESVPAFTEPDPYEVAERMAAPRRNCRSCAYATGDHLGRPTCEVDDGEHEVAEWFADPTNVNDYGRCQPDADNCPGYMPRGLVTAAPDVSELARQCGLVADIKGRDEDEWAYLVEDTGAVRIAHTSWWDRERSEKREPGWAIFEDWRLFATIEDAVRAYAADHTLPRVGARITAKSP